MISRRKYKKELMLVGFISYVCIMTAFQMSFGAPFFPLLILGCVIWVNIIRLKLWPKNLEINGQTIHYRMMFGKEHIMSFSDIKGVTLHLHNSRNAYMEIILVDSKFVLTSRYHSNLTEIAKVFESRAGVGYRFIAAKKDGEIVEGWQSFLKEESFLSYMISEEKSVLVLSLLSLIIVIMLGFIDPLLMLIAFLLFPGLLSYYQMRYLDEGFMTFITYMFLWLILIPIVFWSFALPIIDLTKIYF